MKCAVCSKTVPPDAAQYTLQGGVSGHLCTECSRSMCLAIGKWIRTRMREVRLAQMAQTREQLAQQRLAHRRDVQVCRKAREEIRARYPSRYMGTDREAAE